MNCYKQAMECLEEAQRAVEEAMCYLTGLDYYSEYESMETINLQKRESQMEYAWHKHLDDIEDQWSVFR